MEQNRANRPWVIVRGAGDLATGTILRLHRCGFKVLALECADPSAIRRKAAFCEAVWQGAATVEGTTCRRIQTAAEADAVSAAGEIPLLVDENCAAAEVLHPAAVVDAILAKRNLGTHRGMAPLTVGLGPGFTAGQDVDAVVETMRGHQLGRVIRQGTAIPNTGVPGNIGGFAAERVIHAPASGPMEFVPDATGAPVDIGAVVHKGQCIGKVGGVEVTATLDGVLRGLIRRGYPVTRGLKIADIDPRLEQVHNCGTVSDKARAIAGGVVEALLSLAGERGISLL
ncbi:selenium-dependent molybdenum cofactor biosynthesis protein YqeB [uncultured Subdoligranulum sp.]|uniref:selenium-dependent molybdenum cofactor biosynthesis protein YqeB n=1 Tax=uncultured Subdoligranulum sp. TaxID=512298 RepID=UPI0025E1224C|nr:selenium-dependent molybdenum cofactor biosynthesis protein YqeB [uncultured Subdoligranulum sp.]